MLMSQAPNKREAAIVPIATYFNFTNHHPLKFNYHFHLCIIHKILCRDININTGSNDDSKSDNKQSQKNDSKKDNNSSQSSSNKSTNTNNNSNENTNSPEHCYIFQFHKISPFQV